MSKQSQNTEKARDLARQLEDMRARAGGAGWDSERYAQMQREYRFLVQPARHKG